MTIISALFGAAGRGLRAGRFAGWARRVAAGLRACGRFRVDLRAVVLERAAVRLPALAVDGFLREEAPLRFAAPEDFLAVLLRVFAADDLARAAVEDFFFAGALFFAFAPRLADAEERFFAAAITPPSLELYASPG